MMPCIIQAGIALTHSLAQNVFLISVMLDDASNTSQSLRCQEFDLGIWIIRLHKTRRMNLHPFQLDGLCSNGHGLTHFDAIPTAVLAIGRGKVHYFGQHCANKELDVKSAPNPPEPRTTGPRKSSPAFSYTNPMQEPAACCTRWRQVA